MSKPSLDGGGAAGLRGGMPITGTTGEGGTPGTNTTLLGIRPGGNDRWTNEVVFYDATAALGINSGAIGGSTASFNKAKVVQDNTTGGSFSGDGLAINEFAAVNVYGFLNAFDEMYLRLQFRPPASYEQYFENVVFNRQKILCSREGLNLYKQALRSENDRTFAPQDVAYNAPTYSGVPLTYVAQLDAANIYPKQNGDGVHNFASYDGFNLDATAGTTELANEVINPGPRYMFINGDYLTPFCTLSIHGEAPNHAAPKSTVHSRSDHGLVVQRGCHPRQRRIIAPMITA